MLDLTLLTNPILCTVINEYWKRGIGEIKFISDCAGLDYDDKGAHPTPFNDYLDRIKKAIDYGATACYIQGETADFGWEPALGLGTFARFNVCFATGKSISSQRKNFQHAASGGKMRNQHTTNQPDFMHGD